MIPVDVLAFAAHPDDAELGCGATLALAAESGLRVAVADLTAGEMATNGTPGQRFRERDEASAALGLCDRVCLGLPDGDIGTSARDRIVVLDAIREFRPQVVIAPQTAPDRHPDHSAAGRLVHDACFLAGVAKLGTRGPAHRPRAVYHYSVHTSFTPTFVLDVTSAWQRKLRAIRAYGSQFGPEAPAGSTALAGPGFLDVLEAKGRYFGAMIGAAWGEPFACPGPLAMTVLPGLAGDRPAGFPYVLH
ncbi:MAG TPA: bacillithiol biosynthesis deacetylase BshB1 [Pseudonocardiaceae bacterium]|nr:bacillithiol biosynthesis deacetylase BshB1 [Pseudonocardiaceae bacterium]